MFRSAHPEDELQPRGQMLVMFAIVMSLIVFALGLVIDGGIGLSQRRAAQNASDFAALAGARVVAEHVGGDTVNGTDANVQAAITNAIAANGGEPITFGAPDGPRYIAEDGTLLGYVGAGMPADAMGVTLASDRNWETYFVSLFGQDEWSTSAPATAMGGFSNSAPPPGSLFPAGVSLAFFQTYPFCSGPISADPSDPCYPQHLTPGNLNVPGGFGWLKFGCNGYGLGQNDTIAGECQNNIPFLNEQIGPPSKSFGCCTQAGVDPDPMQNRIGSLPGNKASADCQYYIDNEVTVTVPIWDYAGGTGSNAWYHIVGFAGFQITACPGAKNLEGVWRKAFFTGPVTSTPSGPAEIQALGVQLVK